MQREFDQQLLLKHVDKFDTIVVTGPMGVGKSTLASSAFQKKVGVVMIKPTRPDIAVICAQVLDECGVILDSVEESMAISILTRMLKEAKDKQIKLQEKEDQRNEAFEAKVPFIIRMASSILTGMLKEAKDKLQEKKDQRNEVPSKHKRAFETKVPFIIIDLNESVSKQELKRLLSFCKVIGDEENLAHFYIVMSAGVHTHNINLLNYRCVHVAVKEATDEVIGEFCRSLINTRGNLFELSEKSLDEIIKFALQQLGNNFLAYRGFGDLLPSIKNVEELKDVLAEEGDEIKKLYNRTAISFLKSLQYAEYNTHERCLHSKFGVQTTNHKKVTPPRKILQEAVSPSNRKELAY